MPDQLKDRLSEDTKQAMREKQKLRLLTLRTMLAAIKQQEVDTRSSLNDTDILLILDKMSKQRRESIAQFSKAGRDDLVDKEEKELVIIQEYMPKPLSESEINAFIKKAIDSSGAQSVKDMGKVMSQIRPNVQGRTDMAHVSSLIKQALNNL